MNWKLIGGWMLAVMVTTAATWQIVAIADNQIGEAPVSPVNAAPTLPSGADATTTKPGTATTTQGRAASGSTDTTADSTTTSTSPPTSSSETSENTDSDETWLTHTTVTAGGTVLVSYRPGEVVLETATPLIGFQVEIDKAGPPDVDVEFESAGLRVRFRAEWRDGALSIEVEED